MPVWKNGEELSAILVDVAADPWVYKCFLRLAFRRPEPVRSMFERDLRGQGAYVRFDDGTMQLRREKVLLKGTSGFLRWFQYSLWDKRDFRFRSHYRYPWQPVPFGWGFDLLEWNPKCWPRTRALSDHTLSLGFCSWDEYLTKLKTPIVWGTRGCVLPVAFANSSAGTESVMSERAVTGSVMNPCAAMFPEKGRIPYRESDEPDKFLAMNRQVRDLLMMPTKTRSTQGRPRRPTQGGGEDLLGVYRDLQELRWDDGSYVLRGFPKVSESIEEVLDWTADFLRTYGVQTAKDGVIV